MYIIANKSLKSILLGTLFAAETYGGTIIEIIKIEKAITIAKILFRDNWINDISN